MLNILIDLGIIIGYVIAAGVVLVVLSEVDL